MLRSSSRRIAAFTGVLLVVACLLGPVPSAEAQARVSISSDRAGAAIDPTYATALKVSGTGFQSVKGGHGGLYVFFGTVSGNWRPSKGGVTGENYLYVPDSESQANAGHQKYVAFPGSDTAASANGGVVSAAGRWSTTINVPGATFQAVDRNGKARTVDCRKVRCGIITVGAHGVTSAANETFTPVAVKELYAGVAGPGPSGSSADPGTPAAGVVAQEPAAASGPESGPAIAPELSVDRPSAVAGRALSFKGRGLPAGSQVSAVLDDGVAAAGPFLVGAQGHVTGVVTVPVDVTEGTHELRLYGLDEVEGVAAPSVKFAIAAAGPAAEVSPSASAVPVADQSTADRLGIWFFAAAALVLAAALARFVLTLRRRPRAAHADGQAQEPAHA